LSRNTQIAILMKIHLVGAELLQADGHTGRYEKHSRLSFAILPKHLTIRQFLNIWRMQNMWSVVIGYVQVHT